MRAYCVSRNVFLIARAFSLLFISFSFDLSLYVTLYQPWTEAAPAPLPGATHLSLPGLGRAKNGRRVVKRQGPSPEHNLLALAQRQREMDGLTNVFVSGLMSQLKNKACPVWLFS